MYAHLHRLLGSVITSFAAMLYLRHNTLLERPLENQDIKPRVLGHWGTDPGLVLCYAHCSLLIKKTNINALFITGPGHGAPGILACLWLEGSLARFYPEYSLDKKGVHKLCAGFSQPSGFPRSTLFHKSFVIHVLIPSTSHVNAETPGSIHEGK